MNEIIHEVEGEVMLISQKEDRYGIRLNNPDYKFQWFNGKGKCPYKQNELVKVKVVYNEPFYNIVELVGADQLGKSVENIKEIQIDNPKDRLDIKYKIQMETNRCNLMCKAVELAIHWKAENSKAIKSIYHELLIESEQGETWKQAD